MRARWRWIVGGVVVAVLLLFVAPPLIGRQLRGTVEGRMNAALTGYHVRLGAVDVHPIGFGVDLRDMVVVQDAHPDPPVADIPKFALSVNWKALVFGGVVADLALEQPKLHFDVSQAVAEAADKTPVKERGWQGAVEAIYPLKVNQFRVHEGTVTYVPEKPFKPVELTHLNVRAANIRNVRSPNRTYPSDLRVRATVEDTARLRLAGRADFLAEPFAAVNLHLALDDMRLDYVEPILHRYNVNVKNGTVAIAGTVEYGPKVARVHLKYLGIERTTFDYVHTAATAPVEAERAEAGVKAAKQQVTAPTVDLRVDRIQIDNSTLAYSDRSTDPPYRLFFATEQLAVQDFSNQRNGGTAYAWLRGKFMGNGPTAIDGKFRQETGSPDFDLAVRIENTALPSLNDLWRAYAGFDVAAGDFSFFSQMRVKDRRVQGYVKPIFADVRVYDSEQEQGKSLFHKAYEGIIGGIAWVFENKSENDIATRTDISGTLEQTNVSTFQALLGILENAFFKSILPGLERQRPARVR